MSITSDIWSNMSLLTVLPSYNEQSESMFCNCLINLLLDTMFYVEKEILNKRKAAKNVYISFGVIYYLFFFSFNQFIVIYQRILVTILYYLKRNPNYKF